MEWYRSLTGFRQVLAELYLDQGEAIRVAGDAGLNKTSISFSRKAVDNWRAILEEAVKQARINALAAVALEEYPEYRPLGEAWAQLSLRLLLGEAYLQADLLSELFRKSTTLVNRNTEGVDEAIAWLWGNVEDGKRVAIVRFAVYARLHIQSDYPDLSSELDEWCKQLPRLAGSRLEPNDIQAVQSQIQGNVDYNPTSSVYLMVDLEPVRSKSHPDRLPHRIFLSMHLWHNEGFVDNWDAGECDWEEVPRKILEALAYHFREHPDTIEFFVPMPWLAHMWERNFDRLRYGQRRPRYMATDYNIVVRSRDRQYDRELRALCLHHWRRKWDFVHHEDNRPIRDRLVWYDPHVDLDMLVDELPSCDEAALVGFKIQRLDDDVQAFLEELIWINLEAGTPVLLWSRQCILDPQKPDGLKTFLTYALEGYGNDPADLLALISQLRKCKEARQDDRHPGNHLNLCWDDPSRMLPRDHEASYQTTAQL